MTGSSSGDGEFCTLLLYRLLPVFVLFFLDYCRFDFMIMAEFAYLVAMRLFIVNLRVV